jgi:hypothetical protein
MEESRNPATTEKNPGDLQKGKPDPSATSSETLAEIEESEVTEESGTSATPSPDGAFDEPQRDRADGSGTGGPM